MTVFDLPESPPRSSQRQKLAWTCATELPMSTSQDHHKNQNQHLLTSTVTFPEYLSACQSSNIGGLKNLPVRETSHWYTEKEPPKLPGTLLPDCWGSEPQQPPACLPGKGHCSSKVRHTKDSLLEKYLGGLLLAIGTFYNCLQLSLEKSAFTGS